MRNPILTLTTDFGLADHFVGVMKGVILGILPRARIVDITHGLTPFDVREGAFVILEACRWFPPKTVHVVVVDPGVGTARRPILVEAAGQFFVGPDNGVLSGVYGRHPSRVRHLTSAKYFLPTVSETFHGRDIFAPVAAHLAAGVPPARFGKRITDHLHTELLRPTRTGKRMWSGAVLKIDRFGNLITNFHIDDFPQLRLRPFELIAGVERVDRMVTTFADAASGQFVVLAGSSGYLEVALNQGSAAQKLGCVSGSPVELTVW